MTARVHALIGIPVKTKSGQTIGKLADVCLDCDTGRIETLIVKGPGFIHGLMNQELHIAWSQVVSLSETEAIVFDGTVPMGASHLAIGHLPPSA
ncbi:MAG: PRC-barrel domain-containing protein [Patescibacteria group bacterium]|jgi:sporulation protein YlmC with PRC-barrel domain